MQRWFHPSVILPATPLLLMVISFSVPGLSADTVTLKVVKGRVEYHASTPLLSWRGVNRSVYGTIRWNTGGNHISGSLCVNQSQWDSGRSLRDLHTRRLFETETYPEACYRVRSKDDMPDQSNEANRVRLHGTMQIHGVERNLAIRGVIDRTTSGRTFRGSFQTRITDWDMSPPRTVLMEVRDRVEVEVFLTLEPVQQMEELQGETLPPTTASDTSAPLYRAYCSSCHHPSGRGIPGMAPPLRNRLGTILRHPKGRTYLAKVVLFGLVGPITIQGTSHNGHMPAFANMGTFDNKTAADLLNELVFQLNHRSHPTPFKPYTAEEIKMFRANPISPNRLHALRKDILRGESPNESREDPNESGG